VKGKRCDARGASANTVSRALLAAARTQAEQTKAAPRVTLPLPSARTVKTVAWWTLGIVLAIAAMPFVGRGLLTAAWGIASLFCKSRSSRI
jgi:hypothetical protein